MPVKWICDLCGHPGGQFELATCLGAPKGGVPVHFRCLGAWFERIDQSPFWRPPVDKPESALLKKSNSAV